MDEDVRAVVVWGDEPEPPLFIEPLDRSRFDPVAYPSPGVVIEPPDQLNDVTVSPEFRPVLRERMVFDPHISGVDIQVGLAVFAVVIIAAVAVFAAVSEVAAAFWLVGPRVYALASPVGIQATVNEYLDKLGVSPSGCEVEVIGVCADVPRVKTVVNVKSTTSRTCLSTWQDSLDAPHQAVQSWVPAGRRDKTAEETPPLLIKEGGPERIVHQRIQVPKGVDRPHACSRVRQGHSERREMMTFVADLLLHVPDTQAAERVARRHGLKVEVD